MEEETKAGVTAAAERFSCNLCNQTFSHLSYLRRHVRRQHDSSREKPHARVTKAKGDSQLEIVPRYVCKTCDRSFSDQSNLQRHEKRQHDGVKEGCHKCESCSKAFTRQGDLSRHLINCRADRTCKHCNIEYSCAQTLRRHYNKQHQFIVTKGTDKNAEDNVDGDNEKTHLKSKVFECPWCSKVFSDQLSLTRHRRFCNQMDENSNTYCKQCNKHFFDHSTLVKHVKRKHRQPVEDHNMLINTEVNSVNSNASTKISGAVPNVDEDLQHSLDSEKEFGKENAGTLTDSAQDDEKNDEIKRCQHCARVFMRSSDLSKHLKSGCIGLMCTICNIKYSCLSNLRRHMKQMHKFDTNQDDDDYARNVVDSQNAFESKSDTKLDVFQCKICSLSFPNNIAFGIHSRTHNPLRTCQKCDKTFKAGPEWVEHVKFHRQKKIQMEDKKFCHICGKSFLSYGGFYKHMRTHAGYKVSCKICMKTFSATQTLKIHMRSHKGEKPYQCEICGSRFSQQSHLKRHLDSHAGKRKFQCQTCDKSFMDSSGLRAHERSHTGFKPYECNICSYKTTLVSSLLTHKKIHSMKRDFKCKICERTFTQKHSLLRHEVKHENHSSSVKPGFVTKPTLFCSQCPKGFTTKRGLTRHMQKHSKGLIRNVIRRDVHNGDRQNSEKVSALISSVHGHYQSGNNARSGDTTEQNHDTGPAESLSLNENYSECDRLESSITTKTVINQGTLMQNINTSQISNLTQATESGNSPNETSVRLNQFRASYLSKGNELSRNILQMSNNIGVSQDVVLTTYYEYQDQEEKVEYNTELEKPANQFIINNITNSPDHRVESDSALNIDTEADVQSSSIVDISQPQRLVHVALNTSGTNSNDPGERSGSADGLNTLSNVVCNLEEGTISGWESFRFTESLHGSDKRMQTNDNTHLLVHESKKDLDTASSSCYNVKHVISDEETIILGPETVQNDVAIDSTEEIYQNQSPGAKRESNDMPQSEHILYMSVENKVMVENDIVKDDDFITVLKLKPESEDTSMVYNVSSVSAENESLLTMHKERLHNEETKMKETENVPKSKDLRCKVQCLKCYTKFNSFLKFKKHIKRKCVGKQMKPSPVLLQTTEENDCEEQNGDSHSNEHIIVIKKEDIQNEKPENGEKEIKKNGGKERQKSGEKKSKKCKLACTYCGKTFSFLNSLKFHERKHREPASHICEICGRGFYKPYYLKRHLALHENQTKETCFCSKCGKMFQKETALVTHMRVHMGLDPFPCTLCDKTFTHSSNLKRHMKSHVDGKEDTEVVHSFYCHLCGKGYTAKASLQVHLNTHNGVKPHQCPHCAATFTQSAHLRRHMKSHSGERSVKCELCEKLFYDTSTMKVHLRSHTGERPYSCKICGQSFSQMQNLRVHERKHNGLKKFKCNLCMQEFTTKMSLDRHGKRHEREGILDPEMKSKRYMTVKKMKDKVVPCPDCDRHFTTRKSMLAHHRQFCNRWQGSKRAAAGNVTESENTGMSPPSLQSEKLESNQQNTQRAESKHGLETVERESIEPLRRVREEGIRNKSVSVRQDAAKNKCDELKTLEVSDKTNLKLTVINEEQDNKILNVQAKQLLKDSVTFEQGISDKRHSDTETEQYATVQEDDFAAKNNAYPSRTVIFYSEQGAIRKRNEVHVQPRISQEEAHIGSPNEQYDPTRNAYKEANKIRHSGRHFVDIAPVERKIHESVDKIADSMVSFMQEKNKDRTFTDVADSSRIRVYQREEGESPHIRVYPGDEAGSPQIRIFPRDEHNASTSHQAASYIEDGSEMSIVHVVEDSPYTEIVIEDVSTRSPVEHSAFVPGYTEPIRFSQFPVYSSLASNNALPPSIPTPSGSFTSSSTPHSNVITSVFAPGMLGVPLNLVTLGSMPPGSMDQTSQEQYFHQEPQWRMPCP